MPFMVLTDGASGDAPPLPRAAGREWTERNQVRERRETEEEHKREKNVSKKKQHTSLEEPETGP